MSIEDFERQLAEEKAKLEEIKAEAETSEPQESLPETSEMVQEDKSIEERARELGWDPNHKGPNFVPAKEFVERGSFFRKIDAQNKKIDQLSETIKHLNEHYRKAEQAAYDRAYRDALQARKEAVEVGDTEAFNNADLQVKHLESQRPAPVQPQVPNEYNVFKEKHEKTWLNSNTPENKKMTDLAIAYDNYLAQNNPSQPVHERIQEIEEMIQKQFPHRFQPSEKEKPAAVIRSSVGTTKVGGKYAQRLDENQRRMFDQAKSVDPTLDIEAYAKQLDSYGRLKND